MAFIAKSRTSVLYISICLSLSILFQAFAVPLPSNQWVSAIDAEKADDMDASAFIQLAAYASSGMQEPPGRVEVNLANTGLKPGPVRGEIIGPLQGVRSTTVPWMYRHLFGDQINGAPEPLVYTPIYKFKPSNPKDIPQPTSMDMFKSTPSSVYRSSAGTVEVMPLNVPSLQSPVVSPTTFQTSAPQPPPFVPPVPPDPGNHPEITHSSSSIPEGD